MIALGIVIGGILGAVALGWSGAIAGAFVGFIVMLAVRTRNDVKAREASRGAFPGAAGAAAHTLPASAAAPPLEAALDRRLADIERRLAAIERATGLAVGMAPVAAVAPTLPAETTLSDTEAATLAAAPLAPVRNDVDAPARDEAVRPAPAGFGRAEDGTLVPAPGAFADRRAASSAPVSHGDAIAPPPAANPLWAWFTGGNVLTRIGVIALFFGVGFLLTYLAEFVTVPLPVKLLGIALVGGALVVLGMRLAGKRPGYGLSLEGAGAGILYLTTFAAFKLYDVLPPLLAFVLLVAVAVLTVGLAVRADSQPLAGLAIAGGFLAPFLVATSGGPPARLFGYFAVLNAAIFVLSWVRAWRALNVLGFVFTFALGIFWGAQYYDPAHFATVQPFLALFFLFYVAIAILYAKRGPFVAKAPVDALLVFGVPLVGFALQTALVEDTQYGVAWSAIAVATLYGVLAAALWRRAEEGLALLARAFLVLAIIFATIAIPYACDARWTSAWWALEAAGVYWIGCRQRQPLARAFALLLQVGAAAAFIVGDVDAEGPLFLNASFAGTTLIALAGFATAFVADRHRAAISPHERLVAPLLLMWAGAWWYAGGAIEIDRVLPERSEGNAFLAYAVGSVASALALRRWLGWSRLAWFGVALLPLMALVAFADWERMRTTLTAWGFVVWPLAWMLHWRVLHAADALRAGEALADAPPGGARRVLAFAHAASAISLVAWRAWEASEWVGRAFPEGTVWMPSAAAWPAILYLALIARAPMQRWPFADYRDAYAASAATTIAALLAVWYALVNVISPGGTAPLPYLPLANPLDLTLLAALAALFVWARDTARVPERTLYAWFGAAVFVLVNALVFRAVHQWLDVPWRMSSLLASKPLQATLTLMWSATALPLMLLATRRSIRPLWMVGAGLLAVVVIKLFVLDLGALSGLPRIVAFLGVGALLLLIGYLAPLPPAQAEEEKRRAAPK